MRNCLKLAGAALIACLPLTQLSAQCVGQSCAHPGPGERSSGAGISAPDSNGPSFTGGLYSGYDLRVAPRIVLGAELGAEGANRPLASGSPRADGAKVDPRWSLELTARAGYLIEPSTLAYVRGGYVDSRMQSRSNQSFPHLPNYASRDSWTLGAGIERQFLQRISARLEYLYSEPGNDPLDRHGLLAGIVYRF